MLTLPCLISKSYFFFHHITAFTADWQWRISDIHYCSYLSSQNSFGWFHIKIENLTFLSYWLRHVHIPKYFLSIQIHEAWILLDRTSKKLKGHDLQLFTHTYVVKPTVVSKPCKTPPIKSWTQHKTKLHLLVHTLVADEYETKAKSPLEWQYMLIFVPLR